MMTINRMMIPAIRHMRIFISFHHIYLRGQQGDSRDGIGMAYEIGSGR
jgi:hypothetical protein